MNYNKPNIKEIDQLVLSDVNHYHLDNGIPVYELSYPKSADVIKIELVYKAGRLYEKNVLTSKVCAALIKEGTINYNSKEIANKLDYYGAYMHAQSSMDYASINVLSLNKHFPKISNLVSETIYQPRFSTEEFTKYKQRAIENLKLQLSKNDVLGYRELTEKLYGINHPYGYNSIVQDYKNLNLSDITHHYTNLYTSNNCTLFISGKINDTLRQEINSSIGAIKSTKNNISSADLSIPKLTNLKTRIQGKQELQKSIYIGGHLFNRSHPDYFGMVVLSTILGGYFSSRLNLRIREKEALSYGVDAQLDIMRKDGFFYISTEVENGNEIPTKNAIYEELERLTNELVSTEELSNAVRYIKGRVLNALDGPFKQIKVLQSLILNDIPLDMFSNRLKAIDSVTTADIKRLANIYFDKDRLVEVVVEG